MRWISVAYFQSQVRRHGADRRKNTAWNLYDMYGNVWEWCRDWYAKKLLGGVDPEMLKLEKAAFRVIRGGSWDDSGKSCRSADRNGFQPIIYGYRIGFRLALIQTR